MTDISRSLTVIGRRRGLINSTWSVLIQLGGRDASCLERGSGRLVQQLSQPLQLGLQLAIVILEDLHPRLQSALVLPQQSRLGQDVVLGLRGMWSCSPLQLLVLLEQCLVLSL